MLETGKLYFTVKDIRQILFSNQISKATIMTMIKNDEIPTLRLRRRYLVPRWWVELQVEKAIGEEHEHRSKEKY